MSQVDLTLEDGQRTFTWHPNSDDTFKAEEHKRTGMNVRYFRWTANHFERAPAGKSNEAPLSTVTLHRGGEALQDEVELRKLSII
jgi:hypothetical protein